MAVRVQPWTADEDARLLAAIRAGAPRGEIAAELGRSVGAVASRAGRLRDHGHRDRVAGREVWSSERDRRLVELYGDGRTLLQIADELATTGGAVASRVEVLRGRGEDLAPRKPRWTQERRQALARRRFVEGATLRQLEREFERTRGTITSQLRRLRTLGYDRAKENDPDPARR
ncbi:MAG: hypothetical protein ACK4N5_22130 [Myxococcales bacterium]